MSKIQELRKRLETDETVVFAFLFGSRATGAPRPNSDWDVAVYLESRLSPRERFRHRIELASLLDDFGTTDIVLLNDAPALLAHRVLQGRKLLSRDDKEYIRFFVRTLAQSGDEAYWREIHRRARRQRLEEGRFGRP